MPLSLSRRRLGWIAAGCAVAWMFATCALEVLGMKPVKTSAEREGPYELRHATYDAFGHRGTRTDVYWVGRLGKMLVARNVGRRYYAPGDSSRMLFENCPSSSGGVGPCGAYVWDARMRRTKRVSDIHPLYLYGIRDPWSPDGRSIALVEQDGGEVVHLASGLVTDLAVLRLALPRRGIQGAQWRSDGRLVVTVVEYANTAGPFVNGTRDPYLVDPATRSVTSLDVP
jgi:hypothetical protein